MEVKGRVALVTGAASGIGKTYAIELLNQGAKVSEQRYLSSVLEILISLKIVQSPRIDRNCRYYMFILLYLRLGEQLTER